MVVAKKEKLPVAKSLNKKAKRNKSSLTDRLVPILLIISIGFALAIGSMWQKIQNLESAVGIKVAGTKVGSAGKTQTSGTTSEIQKEILPANYKLGIKFNDAITKMVQMGAIDKEKFIKLYEERSPLTDAQKKLLDNPNSDEIVLNQENAQWTFAKLGRMFKDEVEAIVPMIQKALKHM